jgi:hypothetical protein
MRKIMAWIAGIAAIVFSIVACNKGNTTLKELVPVEEQKEDDIIVEMDGIENITVEEMIEKGEKYLRISGNIYIPYFYDSYEIRSTNEVGEEIQILLYGKSYSNHNTRNFILNIPVNEKTEIVYFGRNRYKIWEKNYWPFGGIKFHYKYNDDIIMPGFTL